MYSEVDTYQDIVHTGASDNHTVLTAARDNTLRLFDTRMFRELKSLRY